MSLTNNQTFPGDVKVGEDLRVNTSTLSLRSDNNRVGVNKLSPGVELDVGGNTYVTSNLTVGSGSTCFHVDTVGGNVGIGTTIPGMGLSAFPNTDSAWAEIGRVRLGRSTTYPAFAHIDMSDGDWYAMLQDNTNGDVYFSSKIQIWFTYKNTALARFYQKNFAVSDLIPAYALHVPKPVKWNIPYINLESPSASFGSNNFHYLNASGHVVHHHQATISNLLTFSRTNRSITVPPGYKGLYRIYIGFSVATWDYTAREFGIKITNRGTVIGYNENYIDKRTPGTYNAMVCTTQSVCNGGDEIKFIAEASPADGRFAVHYPNTHATMFMINPLE